MVRYVFNCWRDQREVLLVRGQFYGDDGAAATRLRRRQQLRGRAVARVSMWMARQHCPHMVESTALLTAALVSDDAAAAGNHNAWAACAVRATYAAAFSR